MTLVENAKRLAAERAVDEIQSGTVIGLGTGSTVRYTIEELGRRLASGRLHDISAIPTSNRTAALARECAIPLTTLESHVRVPLAIDGADEIDPSLNLIKGMGGALLREKIVASAADELIVVADERKLVKWLGATSPLPVEVVPFAVPLVIDRLHTQIDRIELRRSPNGEVFETDEGNAILDCFCGPIPDVVELDDLLRRIPGVIEHGLFLGMARRAFVAGESGLTILAR